MARLRQSAGTGTPRAINRTVRVWANSSKIGLFRRNTSSATPRSNGWGGARNNAVSTALTAKQIAGLRSSFKRAIMVSLPFNRFVTVHWGALGIEDHNAAKATGRLIKLASDWCATKGIKMTWCWVRENDDGDGSKGNHVHIALHCPSEVPIGRMWRRWLKRLTIKKISGEASAVAASDRPWAPMKAVRKCIAITSPSSSHT